MPIQNLSILYVTSHYPFAPSYGAQTRVLNIGNLLGRWGKVSLVIARRSAMDGEVLEKTRREFDLKRFIPLVPAPRKTPMERIRHEIDPAFLGTQGLAASPADREAMCRMIDEHDIVWVHTVHTANVFQIYRWPHTILDIDDIQSRYYASQAKAETSGLKKIMNLRRAILWRRREETLKKRFDLITVVSEEDRRYLGTDRVHVVPNGFTLPAQVPARTPAIPPRIGFIGTLKWFPNQAGVEWFIREVWPRVKREAATAHLRLVGDGSDHDYPEMGADIEGLGWVSDPASEIASWSAMIVPVHVGAGTRIKIAEAFSRKCPVISTSLGAFGYGALDGEDILLADEAQDFAADCVRLIKDRELGFRLSENAWKKFLKRWTWDSIGPSVFAALKACLNQNRRNLPLGEEPVFGEIPT